MTAQAIRLEELRKLLSKNGYEFMVKDQDGNIAQLNIWIGEK